MSILATLANIVPVILCLWHAPLLLGLLTHGTPLYITNKLTDKPEVESLTSLFLCSLKMRRLLLCAHAGPYLLSPPVQP